VVDRTLPSCSREDCSKWEVERPAHHQERRVQGGTLEKAAMIANHASTRTTQLYDRRNDEVSLDEVERILI
jgi:hypothetical protein